MITSQQIKAARALLDWKQSDLAVASALSMTAINNIERAIGSPRLETMQSIQSAFEKAGIEFTDGQGVKLRGEIFEMTKFDGPDFVRHLTDDMLKNLNRHDEVIMCGIDKRLFVQHDSEQVDRYTKAAKALELRERILICEGDNYFASAPEAYRWIPRSLFGKVPYLIYGNRMAVVMWTKPGRTVIVHNKSWVDTFRAQFDFLWSISIKPDIPGVHFHDQWRP